MNNVNENNAMNPAATDENEEAARVSRGTETAKADNAGDAASVTADELENDAENNAGPDAEAGPVEHIAGTDDAEEPGNRQLKITDLAGDFDAMTAATGLVQAIRQQVAADLDAIRIEQTTLDEAAEATKGATEARNSVWGHVVNIVKAVAEATTDRPEVRDMVYLYTVADFMKEKERSTAKAYISTGRTVLIRLLTEQKVPTDGEWAKASYADVRAMLKKPTDADTVQAQEIAATIRERVAFIVRYAAKYGGRSPLERLDRIAAEVEREWNPVKAAKDADSPKAKAAVALQDIRQNSPRESSAVETVAPPVPTRDRGQVGQRHVVRH